MRILQRDDVLSASNELHRADKQTQQDTYFLNFTSATRSLPPLTLSARKTFPVVAIATMWECSLNGLKEIGS